MIGIPHCNSLEPKHPLTDIFLSLLDRFFQQSLGQSQFESHTAQRIFVRHDGRLQWRIPVTWKDCSPGELFQLLRDYSSWRWSRNTIVVYLYGQLLKTYLIFYLAKCTVDISGSITRLLTGTTNDFFLHKSSKPFRRWPVIFQDSFLPHN